MMVKNLVMIVGLLCTSNATLIFVVVSTCYVPNSLL